MTLRRNNEAVFTLDMIKKWKIIPVKITGLAANSCHLGVNYVGNNKSDIYKSFAKLNSLGSSKPPQIDQFISLMNNLADTCANHNELLKKSVNDLIKIHTKKQ